MACDGILKPGPVPCLEVGTQLPSLVKSDAVDQTLKTRVGAQGIKERKYLEVLRNVRLLFVGSFKPDMPQEISFSNCLSKLLTSKLF